MAGVGWRSGKRDLCYAFCDTLQQQEEQQQPQPQQAEARGEAISLHNPIGRVLVLRLVKSHLHANGWLVFCVGGRCHKKRRNPK